MNSTVQLKLFATLAQFQPPGADRTPVTPGESVASLLERLGVPMDQVKLVFINGVRKEPAERLNGGERVGVFPPVGGG